MSARHPSRALPLRMRKDRFEIEGAIAAVAYARNSRDFRSGQKRRFDGRPATSGLPPISGHSHGSLARLKCATS
jgi:hypothetical protein